VILIFAVVAIPLSWLSSRGILNPDESGYSFEARIFLSGRLKADPLIGAAYDVRDTPSELFFANHVLRPDAWFAKFPPGWPLALAAGYAVSAPWLLTPTLGILSLMTIGAIGCQLFRVEASTLAVLFAVLSPFYLVNSIGMMSHALCGLLSALACFCLFRGLASNRLVFFAGMFACLALALQIRPYTAFVLALVMTSATLWHTRTNSSLFIRVFGVGVLFGALAFAGVLFYNHLYTGHWLVSPYALAAGTKAPPELSFRPLRIWQGIVQYSRQTFQETLIGLFPFAYLLAGYALIVEREARREVWILASIYLFLVIAYFAHPEGSGIFLGERFHFEGIFAIFLIAARGLMLLFERWKVSSSAVLLGLSFLVLTQVSMQASVALTVARNGEPYRKIRSAVGLVPVGGIIFLHDSPGFVAKHFNLNQPDWPRAPHLFLVDAEPDHRNEWACRYHVPAWTVAQYDPLTHSAVLTTGRTNCGVPKLEP
jgi:hypothetical protein